MPGHPGAARRGKRKTMRKRETARAARPFTPAGGAAKGAREQRRGAGSGLARRPPPSPGRARQSPKAGRMPPARRLDARARVKPAKPTRKALPVQKQKPTGRAQMAKTCQQKNPFQMSVCFRSGLLPLLPGCLMCGRRRPGAWRVAWTLPARRFRHVCGHWRGQLRIISPAGGGGFSRICRICRLGKSILSAFSRYFPGIFLIFGLLLVFICMGAELIWPAPCLFFSP